MGGCRTRAGIRDRSVVYGEPRLCPGRPHVTEPTSGDGLAYLVTCTLITSYRSLICGLLRYDTANCQLRMDNDETLV